MFYSKKKALALSAVLTLGLSTLLAPNSHAQESNPSYEDAAVLVAMNDLDCSAGEHRVVVGSDGLQHAIGCTNLSSAGADNAAPSNPNEVAPANHWNPYENAYYRCGSSYVRNQQIAYYRYKGTVHASGKYGSGQQCGGSGKVVAASITYKRGGKVLARARATTGQTKVASAWDSPNWWAPETQLYYNFTLR
ncbi:hypothetical protein [Corynebacterium sp. TAE3-ERU2]|uniref:hypothetical protein n=1 Tax=Corynebacterium sp. TAE3-ERU2 TaxID=2849497 RepID=UPI001C46DE5D|nr:hypothetical protein [Corynebacterium sp. TAE3-ERU2]MBV7302043.1 hypothetical protein [Corynebacterium sp. TAE3-ERU2]